MAGRPVDRLAVLAEREVIGDGDRLVVGDQEAVVRTRRRAPRAHPGIGPRLQQVNRCRRPDCRRLGIRRQPFLVGAPAEFGRLHSLGKEAFHRPGVDEDVALLRLAGPLGVALGDVDALDADVAHQPRPAGAIAWSRLDEIEAECIGDIDQRLLREPRHHAGIGPAARHRGRATWHAGLLLANRVAHGVVGPRLGRDRAIEVEAGPRLHDRVDVGDADLAAEPQDVQRRRVDRKVDAEAGAAALGQQRP